TGFANLLSVSSGDDEDAVVELAEADEPWRKQKKRHHWKQRKRQRKEATAAAAAAVDEEEKERGSRPLDYSYSLLTCMNYDFRV
ncbi:hypothetical protein ACJX0J_011539, partial [Zea mays]